MAQKAFCSVYYLYALNVEAYMMKELPVTCCSKVKFIMIRHYMSRGQSSRGSLHTSMTRPTTPYSKYVTRTLNYFINDSAVMSDNVRCPLTWGHVHLPRIIYIYDLYCVSYVTIFCFFPGENTAVLCWYLQIGRAGGYKFMGKTGCAVVCATLWLV